jgi:Domain of unknown function (DUF929)
MAEPGRRSPGEPRRGWRWWPWAAGGVVIVVVVVIIAVALTSGGSKATARSLAPAEVVQATTNVPPATLAAVGLGPSGLIPPKPLTGAAALTSNGLPQVLYVGAEWCPFCAAQRWPMVVALSRFGTFSNLGATESATNEVYPGTKTFSFYGSSYTSPFLAFTSVETQTNQPSGKGYVALQQPTPAQQQLLQQYDRPPYTQTPGDIPFVDFANHYILSGASYSPQVLQVESMSAIAGSLADPATPIAQNINGTANIFTAAICQLTNNQPGQVCNTPTITAARAKLGG